VVTDVEELGAEVEPQHGLRRYAELESMGMALAECVAVMRFVRHPDTSAQ
jgi:hypothetical protein